MPQSLIIVLSPNNKQSHIRYMHISDPDHTALRVGVGQCTTFGWLLPAILVAQNEWIGFLPRIQAEENPTTHLPPQTSDLTQPKLYLRKKAHAAAPNWCISLGVVRRS